MKRFVFNNAELETAFQRDGYVIVDFMPLEKAEAMKQKFFDTLPESGGQITASETGFEMREEITYDFSFIDKNPEYKRLVFDVITKELNSFKDIILKDYKVIIANYIRKTPEKGGEVPLHQNWAFADEKKCCTVSVWCPLVDATIANGTLQVVPGSHKRFGEYRGPMVPWELEGIKHEIIDKHLKPIEILAGKAVILDDSIVHYSAQNKTNDLRLAIQLICIPTELPLLHYYKNPTANDGKIDILEVNEEFFIQFNPWQFPTDTKSVGKIDFSYTPLTEAEFSSRLYGERFDIPKPTEAEKNSLQKLKSAKMKQLFKDPKTQEHFDKYGFARFNILEQEDVQQLLDYFHEQNLRDRSGYGFNMSMEDDDKEKVARIRKKIYDIALPKALPHFHNAKVIAGSFVVKEKNPQGVVPPHQDWSFVENEGENYSVTCWIPLVPTNMQNGYMGVIKGSHLIYENIRPSPSPQVPTPLMNHLFSIFPYLEMYEMQPGEALIFDHRTFHASTPNITDEPRIAIGLGFTQADSEICHYTLKQNEKKDILLKYKVDDNFLLKYDNSRLSKMYAVGEKIEGYEIVEELPYVFPNPNSEELLEKIKAAGNVFNVELCEHMAKLFNYDMTGNIKEESKAPEPERVLQETESYNEDNECKKPFWQVYTPGNILREIKLRVTGN